MQARSAVGHVNPVLAGRIQGFGNVNPPPVEDDTGATVAKRAVGRLGDIVGEEVLLTVEDFRDKGAVGAVKDAVADAGDILIDGVAAIVGWVRGDPPIEPEDADLEHNEMATHALSRGPAGAAYGVTQASPTGGINAVWVMPEEADPAALAQLVLQQQVEQRDNTFAAQMFDSRVHQNIQPYGPSLRDPHPQLGSAATIAALSSGLGGAGSFSGHGIEFSPYEPAPSRPTASAVAAALMGPRPALTVGAASFTNSSGSRWGLAGSQPGAGGIGASNSGFSPSSSSSAKGLVERIARGEVLADAASAKRLASQCGALKISSPELAETICERARRLYLGLDAADPAEADKALLRLLQLAAALSALGSDFGRETMEGIAKGIHEELGSLRSCELLRKDAEPFLRRLGLLEGGAAVCSRSAPPENLLDDAVPEVSVDLLGGSIILQPSSLHIMTVRAKDQDDLELLVGAAECHDLLGGGDLPYESPVATDNDLKALDPMHVGLSDPAGSREARLGEPIESLLDAPAPEPVPVLESLSLEAVSPEGPISGVPDSFSGLSVRESQALSKERIDAFGFVGQEMSKAEGAV